VRGARPTILDLGVGNLGNVERALRVLGAAPRVTCEPAEIATARTLVLPGVGAFRPPRERLRGELEAALREALDAGAWLLGICVGFQLLFEASEEDGITDGLGLLPGRVVRLPDTVPVPHIGWNRLRPVVPEHPLLAALPADASVYFVHSFAPVEVDGVALAEAEHGVRFAAVAGRERIVGTQFHPEKSGAVGLRLLASFLEIADA
jgi:glutamine amidotransferase